MIAGSYNNFTAGELSPRLYGRTDLAKYFNGCKTLHNMLVWPHGGVFRRPGTRFVAESKFSTGNCRLVRFAFSVTQQYVLEFGNEYVRFYKDQGQIVKASADAWADSTSYAVADFVSSSDDIYRCTSAHTSASATEPGTGASWEDKWEQSDVYEIYVPYQSEDLALLRFTQSADVLYVVHPLYPPMKITRTDHDAWAATEADIEGGPFMTENLTAITITPSAVTGSNIDLTASAALFDSLHVGALFRLTHDKAEYTDVNSFSSASNGTAFDCYGDWQFVTHGTWTATVKIQRSFDGGTTWLDYQTFTAADDRNINVTGTESRKDVKYRVICSARTSGTAQTEFHVREYEVDGIVKIKTVTSATAAKAEVLTTLGGTGAVTRWAEGSWSDLRGWPHTITFFEERLWFGATNHQPQTIWGSVVGDYENFLAGAEDADSVAFTIASDEVNIIRWMKSKSGLVIGTSGAEWRLSSTQDAPVTPSNVAMRRETTYGSGNLDALVMAGNVLYVQSKKKQLMQFAYNLQEDNYVGIDLTLLSEHITGGGIVEMELQREPLPVIWIVRTDGSLVGLTYLPYHEVTAWHRHSTLGTFESVTSIDDEVWVSVFREIEGSTVRYIEYFEPWDETLENSVFMDSALCYDGVEKTITAITKADPAVVTSTAHGFSNGDVVRITAVAGMTELNNIRFSVANKTDNTFELFGIDSTDYETYESGGIAKKCASTVSGLDHLEGEEVVLIVDGSTHPHATVETGSVSLATGRYGSKIWVGMEQPDPVLQTMNIEAETQAGTAQGYLKRIIRAVVRLYKSLSIKMSSTGTAFEEVVFRTTEDTMGNPPELYTGDKKILMPKGSDREAYVYLTQEDPLPLTVTAIIYEVEVGTR